MIQRFADDFTYEPVTFTSIDSNGQPIYHTNVMMCIGTAFAMVGLAMIPNKAERQQVRARLEKTGKEIVELSADQIANFAGNAIELHNKGGEKLLVLSSRADRALTEGQRERLSRYGRLILLELPTIELGGGSARCMIANDSPATAVVAALCGALGEAYIARLKLYKGNIIVADKSPKSLYDTKMRTTMSRVGT